MAYESIYRRTLHATDPPIRQNADITSETLTHRRKVGARTNASYLTREDIII